LQATAPAPGPSSQSELPRPFDRLSRLWEQPAGVAADISATALVLAISGITAYIGAVHTMIYGHDIFLILDAGWRVLNGQRPNVDFSPSLSPALGLLLAGALRLAHNSVNAVGFASALVGATAGFLGYWLTRPRMGAVPAVLASIVLTLITVAPFPVGLLPNALSQAMLYNRYGYALLGLVLLEAFQGSRDCDRARAVCGGFVTGVVSVALLFLKPSYSLVALGFVACSIALVRHNQWRFAGILLGLLLTGGAMMAYLGFNFAAVWNDLALMSAAKSSAVNFWAIRWAIFKGLADFLPLALLALLIRTPRSLAMSAVVFIGGALLLATNGQPTGFPLNALLAILLAEQARTRSKRDAIPILIGLIAYLPVCCGSAAGLGFALLQSAQSPPSEVARFEPSQLANLLLYDLPEGTDADRRSNGRAYVTYVNSGIDLLQRVSRADETVFTLDAQNPFSYALLRRPAHGGSACLSFNHTFNDAHKPSSEWLFGSADIVMVPKYPSASEPDADALFRNYYPSIKTGFRLCAETEWWKLYKRPWNLAGCGSIGRSENDVPAPPR
jgi:hypothetical protein